MIKERNSYPLSKYITCNGVGSIGRKKSVMKYSQANEYDLVFPFLMA